MISLNKIESLRCQIHENIQKIQIYELTSDKNKEILIDRLRCKNYRLSVNLVELKEKEL